MSSLSPFPFLFHIILHPPLYPSSQPFLSSTSFFLLLPFNSLLSSLLPLSFPLSSPSPSPSFLFPPPLLSSLPAPSPSSPSLLSSPHHCSLLLQVEEAEVRVADTAGETVNKIRIDVIQQQEQLIREEAQEKEKEVCVCVCVCVCMELVGIATKY